MSAHSASGPDCGVGRWLEASPPARVQRAQVWPPPGLISSAACWARAASSQGLCLPLAEETQLPPLEPPAPAPRGTRPHWKPGKVRPSGRSGPRWLPGTQCGGGSSELPRPGSQPGAARRSSPTQSERLGRGLGRRQGGQGSRSFSQRPFADSPSLLHAPNSGVSGGNWAATPPSPAGG